MELLVFKSEKRMLRENIEAARLVFSELYSTDQFTQAFFPDLNVLLKSFLQEEMKSNREFSDRMSGKLKDGELEELMKETFSISSLLSERPGYIALLYRHCIHRFVARKHYNTTEVEDIVQEIVQVLIARKLKAIRKGYEGDFNNVSQFSSYFMVVVRNIYIDILRKYRNEPLNSVDYVPEEVENNSEGRGEIPASLAVEMEMRKLGLIFRLFGKTAPRFSLLMRLKYRTEVNEDNVLSCYPSCSKEDIVLFTGNYSGVNDREMFSTICDAVNRNESKPSKSDTLRKWVDIKIKEVITHLNRHHGSDVYNSKIFEELAILFFQKSHDFADSVGNRSFKSEVG